MSNFFAMQQVVVKKTICPKNIQVEQAAFWHKMEALWNMDLGDS